MSEIKTTLTDEANVPEQNLDVAPENKRGFLTWVKNHKKQLILAGVSITTIVGIILGIKNKDVLTALWKSLSESVKKAPVSTETIPVKQPHVPTTSVELSVRAYTPPVEAFDVSRHVRTMAEGKHHSAAKAAEAMALGIDLPPNQTLVGPYTKCAA